MAPQSVVARALYEHGLPTGFAATCPVCKIENQALYAPEATANVDKGELVWWPGGQPGTWCIHCQGCYDSGDPHRTFFLFLG